MAETDLAIRFTTGVVIALVITVLGRILLLKAAKSLSRKKELKK